MNFWEIEKTERRIWKDHLLPNFERLVIIWSQFTNILQVFSHTAQKMKFFIKDLQTWPNLQFPVDLVTFTEEILNGEFYFLCSATFTYLVNLAEFWEFENVPNTFSWLSHVFLDQCSNHEWMKVVLESANNEQIEDTEDISWEVHINGLIANVSFNRGKEKMRINNDVTW